MALMHSCCCWRSVRRGSFACAVYTGVYFGLLAIMTGGLLKDEHEYMLGNRSLPESISFLEPENMSHVTVGFYVSLFICSCFGVVTSVVLLIGLLKDRRRYLLPWVVNVLACSLIDVVHTLYLFTSQGFEPTTALVYTLDFFLLCLNVYSLLCVISQYQEYGAGRGRAIDDCEHRIPAIRYAAQPTTATVTSCLSSRRTVTSNNETKGTSVTATASGSPSQSPTVPHKHTNVTPMSDKSLTSGCSGRNLRKHVSFPDEKRDSISNQCTPSAGNVSNNREENSTMEKEIVQIKPSSLLAPPTASQFQSQARIQPTTNQVES